jgi:predicted ATPase
MDPCEPLE